MCSTVCVVTCCLCFLLTCKSIYCCFYSDEMRSLKEAVREHDGDEFNIRV